MHFSMYYFLYIFINFTCVDVKLMLLLETFFFIYLYIYFTVFVIFVSLLVSKLLFVCLNIQFSYLPLVVGLIFFSLKRKSIKLFILLDLKLYIYIF